MIRSKNFLTDVITMYATLFLNNILFITFDSFTNDISLITYYIFVYSIIDSVHYGHMDVTL